MQPFTDVSVPGMPAKLNMLLKPFKRIKCNRNCFLILWLHQELMFNRMLKMIKATLAFLNILAALCYFQLCRRKFKSRSVQS